MAFQLIPRNCFAADQCTIRLVFLHSNTCAGIRCRNLLILFDLVGYKTASNICLRICVDRDRPVGGLFAICYLASLTLFGDSGIVCRRIVEIMFFSIFIRVVTFCCHGIFCLICRKLTAAQFAVVNTC